MCKIERSVVIIDGKKPYAACCSNNGHIHFCGCTPKVLSTITQETEAVSNSSSSLQMSIPREPIRVSQMNEDLRRHCNMTRVSISRFGEKIVKYFSHDSHGKHGRKPRLAKQHRQSLVRHIFS